MVVILFKDIIECHDLCFPLHRPGKLTQIHVIDVNWLSSKDEGVVLIIMEISMVEHDIFILNYPQ